MRLGSIIENIFTLLIVAAIIIWAPGGWKVIGVVCLLNLNYPRSQRGAFPGCLMGERYDHQ